MAGSLGEVWYDIVARDRTKEGLASATAGTAKATAEIQKATAAAGKTILKETRSSAQQVSQLGMGIAMLGNTLSNAAVQAKLFGINLGGTEPVIGGFGVALGTVGSTMAMTQSLMKAWAVINYGTLIPSIQAAVIATYAWVAANAALTFGLSLVVAGLATWYFQSQRNASADARMEATQKDLEGQVADTKKEIVDLTDALKELENIQNRLAGVAADVSQADRDHQRAVLGLKDAQTEYNTKIGEREKIEKALTQVSRIAAETGLPEAEVRKQLTAQLTTAKDEETRAHLDVGDAQARETQTQQGYNDALAEQTSLQQAGLHVEQRIPRLTAQKETVEQQLQLMPGWARQIEGRRQQVAAAGAQQWAAGPGATTTITIGTVTVANGQTVTQVLADLEARNQKNVTNQGVPRL